jgi:hypothetical protein
LYELGAGDSVEISNKPTKPIGKGCVLLFGLVFFLIGLGVGFWGLSGVVKSIGAKNWTPTKAVILDASLYVSRGEDSDTYRASGQFQYEWDGQSYVSDQVFFSKTSDSGRKFHNRVVGEMRSSKSQQKPMTVYVNPKKPHQAVLYPKIRWAMVGIMAIFSLIFGGVGAAIIAGGQYAGRIVERENKRKTLHPDRPWLWKDEWQTAEIKNSGKIVFYGALGFTVLWNLISLPMWFVIPLEIIDKKNYAAAIGFLFPLVGIGLAIWTYKAYRRWKRFGHASFVLDTYPAALGHILQGKLTFRELLPPGSIFKVKLSSIYKYSTGSGDDRRTEEDIKWQDEQHIPLKEGRHSGMYSLPIRFKLPADQHATAWDEGDREYIWRLSIRSEQEGADFIHDFDVPVFDPNTYNIRVPASAQFDESVTQSEIYTDQGNWQKTGVQEFEMAGGHAYYFKPARHKMMGVSLIFMFLIFGGIGSAPLFADMPLFMGIVFGGFALLLGWFALIVWLYKSQIEVTPGTLSVRAGLFGGSYKTVDIDDIAEIDLTSNMTSGTVKYYDIFAKTRSGDKIKMAIHLLGKRDVQALIDKIKTDLGMHDDA